MRARLYSINNLLTDQHIAPAPPKTWTILSLIEWGAAYLAERGFDEARLHVELLLAHVLQLPRMGLYLQFDRPLTAGELGAFKPLFERRIRHEPLQYIVGETEFMGLRFIVDRTVLIPRPETELLVERALELIQGPQTVLDIGTGSGNVAVALGHARPEAQITSVDMSTEALATAARNVERHEARNVRLVQGDLFSEMLPGETFDLIVSNPPYVPAEEYARLEPEVRDYEPRPAVTDGGDGLAVIRRIFALCPRLLRPHGVLLMEIGFGEQEAVRALALASGLAEVEIFNDYAGIPRIFKALRRTEHP